MSVPLRRILPRSGSTSRLIMRKVVDLPEPDAPISTTNSPSAMCKDKSSTAGRAPP
jgi:hypothetical protein